MRTFTAIYIFSITFGLFAFGGCASKSKGTPANTASQLAPASPATKEATIRTQEVVYQSGDTQLKGYIAWDSSMTKPQPGVIVVHEWWGHNEYTQKRARMLAELGYTALAIDMYGDGKQAAHPADAKKFMMEVFSNIESATKRFDAGMALLKQHPSTDPTRIAAIGYCFGGGVVLHMARQGKDLQGVASFHGSLATEQPATPGSVRAKILVLNGAADPMAPAEQVKAFEDEMAAAQANYELVSYPGAKHAFTNPGATALGEKFQMPLAYNKNADTQSWSKMTTFLEEIFE